MRELKIVFGGILMVIGFVVLLASVGLFIFAFAPIGFFAPPLLLPIILLIGGILCLWGGLRIRRNCG